MINANFHELFLDGNPTSPTNWKRPMSQQLIFTVVAGLLTPDTFYLVNKGTETVLFMKKVADPCSKTLHAFNWQHFPTSTPSFCSHTKMEVATSLTGTFKLYSAHKPDGWRQLFTPQRETINKDYKNHKLFPEKEVY